MNHIQNPPVAESAHLKARSFCILAALASSQLLASDCNPCQVVAITNLVDAAPSTGANLGISMAASQDE
jgi:hypothetical protein